MDMRLGAFGDARLEASGIFFWGVWCRMAAVVSASVGLAGTAPGKCGSAGFCTIAG